MEYKIAFSPLRLKAKLDRESPTWSTLVDSFVNRSLEPIDIIEHIALGHPFTNWHEGRKSQDNFVAAQFIAVDLDTDDDRSSIATIRKNIVAATFSFFTYATPSHGLAGPRSRIMFLLDEPITTVAGFKSAAAALYHFFPHCDTSVGEPSKFLYGMTSIDAPHWWNAKVLPLRQLRIWHVQQRRNNPKPEPRQSRNVVRISDYRNRGDKLAEVAEALQYIDPWSINYNTWIGYLAALKRELGPAALNVAVNWAGGKPGEVEREWERHLRNEHHNPMTLGTIFSHAIERGWKGKVGT